MAKETMMENPIKKLREVLDKREKLEEEGKPYIKGTPKELQDAIDTFFIHCKNMVEYDLQFIPGEALADLCDVLAKYPKYQHIADDLVFTLNTEYGMKV